MTKHEEPILFTYRGDGGKGDRFYGVPRRSLTQVDFDALTISQQKNVLASNSYVERKAESKPQAAPAVKPDDAGGKE